MSEPVSELPDLDRLEQIAREAPPGPYTLCPAPYWDVLDAEGRPVRAAWLPCFARYVHAAQPDAVLALLAECRRFQDLIDAVSAQVKAFREDETVDAKAALLWVDLVLAPATSPPLARKE